MNPILLIGRATEFVEEEDIIKGQLQSFFDSEAVKVKMSLSALKLASSGSGNPVTRLLNSSNVFLISATAIATLHFGMGTLSSVTCVHLKQ